jgi:hypothetical protein
MYENQRIQASLGGEIQQQGQVIERGIGINQEIRREANHASDAIQLIQTSILRRKFMFYSLFVLLAIAITFIIMRKLFK